MKAGLVIYGSLDTLSGGYLYDRQLVSHMRRAGWQVDVLSLPWRNYAAHLSDNLRLAWARNIAAGGYDLLLQDELNHPSLFLLNHALRIGTMPPLVSIVHHLRSAEDHPPRLLPLYRQVERHYLRSVDGFIFNSRTTRAAVQSLAGQHKPHVIAYPAADHRAVPRHDDVVEVIAARLKANGPLQLLFVGNLIARKGLHTVINALARLDATNWHFHVVGSLDVDPDYAAAMRRQAGILGIAAQITWYGRLSDAELNLRYAAADLLVMPSYEGFGIVFLEAMAHGLSVIAASTGAAPELIEPGITGYLTPPDDVEALSAVLRRLLTNRVHLAALAHQARLRYERHPTWSQSMDTAIEWLRKFTSQVSPAARANRV